MMTPPTSGSASSSSDDNNGPSSSSTRIHPSLSQNRTTTSNNRRDKRRQSSLATSTSSSASAAGGVETTDNTIMKQRRQQRDQNPYTLLNLAVRFDESFQDESILRVPLETASIYNNHNNRNSKLFAKALQYLQQKSSTSISTSKLLSSFAATTNPESNNDASSSQQQQMPMAFTPIIFSGLLATIHEQNTNHVDDNEEEEEEEEEASRSNKPPQPPSSSDLVAYCQNMRQAAIARVKLRNQRRRIRRTMTPLCLILGLLVLCSTTVSNLKRVLIDYNFVDDSCQSTACRLHSVAIWEVLSTSDMLQDCTIDSCNIVGEEGGPVVEYTTTTSTTIPIYAFHTQIQLQTIPLDEVGDPKKQRRRKRQQSTTRQDHHHYMKRSSSIQLSPLQWLGETTVNSLVREEIIAWMRQWSSESTLKVLDVGCGVGGTLYSLVSSSTNKNNNPSAYYSTLYYDGIALAGPEINEARRLIDLHLLDELSSSPSSSDAVTTRIQFQQKDYNDPLGGEYANYYNTMIAVESLSYSPNITKTLTNLAASMQSKGLLVIVDDVVSSWARNSKQVTEIKNLTERPSLLTHQEWLKSLSDAGFQIKTVRDLSLEMDLTSLMVTSPSSSRGGFFSERLMTWRYRTADFVLQRWPLDENATLFQKTSMRTIQLVQDLIQTARGTALRYDGFKDAELVYHFYVAQKS